MQASEMINRTPLSPRPLRCLRAAPAHLVLFSAFADAENLPITLAVNPDRHQQRHVTHFAGPAALEHDAVEINVRMLAFDRPNAPRLDRPVDLLVQVRHGRGRHPRAPQGLGNILDPANRDAGQIHLDQSLLDRAFAPPIAPDDRRFKGLRPKLRYPQLDLAGLGPQLAFIMPGPGIGAGFAALVALRVAQPIRLGIKQRVQRLLHAASHHAVEVVLDPIIIATAAALASLVEALRRDVLEFDVLHGDDTPVPVLAPGAGKTKTGRLWTYVRDERPHRGGKPPAAMFFYSPDRKGEHPVAHLQDFTGVLHADGYAGFNGLYESGRIVEAACWAHVRRKFFDVHAANGSAIAKEALDRIGALYGVEAAINGMPPGERRRLRQAQSKPIADALKAWAEGIAPKLSGRSELAAAFRYMLARWQALNHCFDDGRLSLDNNPAERALRGVAIGRKNYLFAGSDRGGERAAAMYSLIETAKLNGINPEAYLRDVLARIADHPNNRIIELLPWNWQSPEQAAKAA